MVKIQTIERESQEVAVPSKSGNHTEIEYTCMKILLWARCDSHHIGSQNVFLVSLSAKRENGGNSNEWQRMRPKK
jgi:hypothetical protein